MMSYSTTVALCLLLGVVCSGLVLERLPHRIPSHRSRFAQDVSLEEDDALVAPSFDSSVDMRKIGPNTIGMHSDSQRWKDVANAALLERHFHHYQEKRDTDRREKDDINETSEKDRDELADILKDDDQEDDDSEHKEKKEKHSKTKRQSSAEAEKAEEIEGLADAVEGEQEVQPHNPDFQDWLRREYYRNMAKSFASMRRKRDGGTGHDASDHSRPRRDKKSRRPVSFEEVSDNLRAMEDVLFLDALHTMKEAGDDYEEDMEKQRRITRDLSSAYDLETMRNALFRLRDNLGNMEQEQMMDEETYRPAKKRGDQCPPLDLLTSDCSTLGDIVPDGPMKRLLLHACNWHEVCYTCGESFGLTSETCDVGFVEQSQTICRGDVPCESTANLLLLPLRQRRVFYKRSNPSVCLVDPCVEDFLIQV